MCNKMIWSRAERARIAAEKAAETDRLEIAQRGYIPEPDGRLLYTQNGYSGREPGEADFEMACERDWLRVTEYAPDQLAETEAEEWMPW